jgi:hypothetical protein
VKRRRKRKKKSIPGQARSHHRSPAVHPTRLRALATLFPAATRSRFVTRPEGAVCHPQARLPSPFRVPLRHHKARALRPANRTRRVAQAIMRPLPHHSGGSLSPPLRPCQDVRGMPMPPRHPAAGGGRQRPSTAPNSVSPTPTGGLTAMRP